MALKNGWRLFDDNEAIEGMHSVLLRCKYKSSPNFFDISIKPVLKNDEGKLTFILPERDAIITHWQPLPGLEVE